jgi:hypothetical protein
MVLKTDTAAPDTLLKQLRARPGIMRATAVALPPRNN